jgi:succinoglycan biosynthesis transport protein ExoP
MLQRLTPTDKIGAGEREGSFDLREILNFLWRRWKLISAVTALSLLVGAIYLAKQTPLYTATTQILIDPRK